MATENEAQPHLTDGLPNPHVRQGGPWWRVQIIWIVPIVALVIGVSLGIRSWLSTGPTIRIWFETAEGLSAGKTEVRYKEVVIGQVYAIELSDDRNRVIVSVELHKSAASFAVDDTRFWVVRPRVGIGGVSGLGTLLSGAYIGADIGQSHEERRDFTGLEIPPAVTHGMQGKRVVLHSGDLGSLDIGSPIYFRRIQIGRVVAYQLDDNGGGVTLQAFVDTPNDRYLTRDARFWNASGVDLDIGASGVHLNTQSLATVVAGGIAFQPSSDADTQPAAEGAEFQLHSDIASAMAPPDGAGQTIHLVFKGPARGLASGSAVDFAGVPLGTVQSVDLDYRGGYRGAPAPGAARDRKPDGPGFVTDVTAEIFPQRLGRIYPHVANAGSFGKFIAPLVQHGFRAQLRHGNLLTGQLSISLGFVDHAPPAAFDPSSSPLQIPTSGDALDQMQQQIGDVIRKLDAIPFDAIGNQLNDTLKNASELLQQLDQQIVPEARAALQDLHASLDQLNNTLSDQSPLMQNTQQTLGELQRAARAFRALSDYLDRHPESLIRGKVPDSNLKLPPGTGNPP